MAKQNRTIPAANPADHVAAIAAAATDPAKAANAARIASTRLADMLQSTLAVADEPEHDLDSGVLLGRNVVARREGDLLHFTVSIGDLALRAAKPSKGKKEGEQGALCLVASSGGFKAVGFKGLRMSLNLGFPNPNAPKRG